jgi:hypothetical protein
MDEQQSLPETDKEQDTSESSTLSAVFGFLVGLVAGVVLFVSTYPWDSSGTVRFWHISVFDGIVIATVGGLAYPFRKRSGFWQGVFISAAMLFIVNGLCGISGG